MKTEYSILYFNNYFSFQDDYLYLRVINRTDENQIHCVWWHEDKYKHYGTIGQWRIKLIKTK